MQIFCTGSSGLVASDFRKLCLKNKVDFIGMDLHGEKESVDIMNPNNISDFIKNKIKKNAVLFHFAALTITGKNLTQEQIDLTNKVNIDGTENIIKACTSFKIPLVYISTDFVFSGSNKTKPYLPLDKTQADETVYSQSKFKAENLVLESSRQNQAVVIRIAFPYGNFTHPKMGLARKMISWMDGNEVVNLYANQKISPTPISYISKACFKTAQLLVDKKIPSGQILHCVGKVITPFEFGSIIKRVFDKKAQLNPTYPSNISLNMALDTKETDQILGFTVNTHEQELIELKKNSA